MKIKIGDLVSVLHPAERKLLAPAEIPFFTIVTGTNVNEDHPNKMQFVEVLERDGRTEWYPIGYIKVENESR